MLSLPRAVTFESKGVTETVGDTVAFEHVGGAAHSATASEENVPHEPRTLVVEANRSVTASTARFD